MTRTRTRAVAVSATAATLALALTACSGDSEPDSTTPGSSETTTSQSSTAAPTKDRSKQVFDAYTPRQEVLGSTTGKVPTNNTSRPNTKVTFEVLAVEATADSTILRYQLTAEESEMLGIDGADWSYQPMLRVPGTHTREQSLTAALPEYDGQKSVVCVCTALTEVLPTPQPQEVVYPALPKDVQKIDVILDELDPVTVPVTR